MTFDYSDQNSYRKVISANLYRIGKVSLLNLRVEGCFVSKIESWTEFQDQGSFLSKLETLSTGVIFVRT